MLGIGIGDYGLYWGNPPSLSAANRPMILNDGCTYRERLGPEAHGQTVLAYLSQRYRHSSAAEWAARIEAGHVLIDAQPVSCAKLLQRGCELTWQRPPWREPEAPTSFTVLYEDADLIAVAKPAGLPTLPGAHFLQTTLLYQLQRYAVDAAPVHRLGRWTSGLVLCTRNRAARTEVMRQWSAKEVGKRYRALASGCPERNEMTIALPIGPVPHPLLGSVHAASAQGKASLSQVRVLERQAEAFVCDVSIATGRPHQIRIHLAAAGHPLVGDPLYLVGGVPAADSRAVPGDAGYLLHSAELSLRHPRTGQALIIECAPPQALRIAGE